MRGDPNVHDGTFVHDGGRVWYRVVDAVGRGRSLPLVVLHGGPGVPHDYLEPLQRLALAGRPVVYYDQLGCGGSGPRPNGPPWTVEGFVAELEAVLRHLGLERFHLLGHSWGGMLALEFACRRPPGLAGLVAASCPASMRAWSAEAERLRADLPDAVRRGLDEHERLGLVDRDSYLALCMDYYRRHVCRLDPWPECVVRAFAKMLERPEVYHSMNGPSDFRVTGTLRDWTIEDRLCLIGVPTLVTSGRYDEATPALAERLHRGIAGSSWELFEQSAHLAHVEEPGRYLRRLEAFLDRAER
jgi:L-proline amide hydrolase